MIEVLTLKDVDVRAATEDCLVILGLTYGLLACILVAYWLLFTHYKAIVILSNY